MQLLFDFFPVIAFFVTYKITGNLFVATGVIIVSVIAQTGWQWFRHRKVSQMALISGALVLIFGGLTLLIHDKVFIQWKVSVVNWLFAAGFLASRFFGDKLLIERMMGENVQLDEAGVADARTGPGSCFSPRSASSTSTSSTTSPKTSGSTSSCSACSG